MEGGNPVFEWITYAIVGFLGLGMLALALRSAWFFLSLLLVPVLGALSRSRVAGGAVRRWGARLDAPGTQTGRSTLSLDDEEAVDAAVAASGGQAPPSVRRGMAAGALLGAVPGLWWAIRGIRLAASRGDSFGEVVATAALALGLVAAAGVLVGTALGALVGAGWDALTRRSDRR